jgi:hypothetical protein
MFIDGETKSHLYKAGDRRSICGSQLLRHKQSENLPEVDFDRVDDLCELCKNVYTELKANENV